MPREERRAPHSAPDVRRRDSQARDGTCVPIQGRGDAVQAIQEVTCLGSGKFPNRNICCEEVVENTMEGCRVGKGQGKGAKELDELGFKGGWMRTKSLQGSNNPARSLTLEVKTSFSICKQTHELCRRIPFKDHDQRNAKRVLCRVRAIKNKGQRLRSGPGGKIRVPVWAKLRPSLEDRLPACRKAADHADPHGCSQEKKTARLLFKNVSEVVRPNSVAVKEGTDPLSLQRLGLNHRRKEIDTAKETGTATNCHGRRESGVVIPDGFPAETGELAKNSRRRGGKAKFVPQATEEFGRDKKRTASKGETARENILRDSFQAGVKSIPVLLNPIR